MTRPNDKGEAETQKIHINYLHVGDIVHLKYGMLIPVDGIVLSCNQLMTNEAAMTGESDERRKERVEVCQERLRERGQIDYSRIDKTESHSLPSSLLLSGTSVAGGDGKMLCIMVGKKSALGEIMDKLTKRDGETPLQQKLEIIATEIGKIGTYAALLTIHVLLFRYFLDGILKRNIDLFGGESEYDRPFVKNFKQWVDYVVIGVAVIVVAVPEGLPLAVMISLAYSQGKMLKDANYVKKLAACEIMGGATNICSDKTGTLTLNQMKVAHVWTGRDIELNTEQDENKKMKPLDAATTFNPKHWEMISTAIACNVPDDFGATDKGMVDLLERCAVNMNDLKTKHKTTGDDEMIRFPFSSSRKRMSTVIQNATGNGGYDKRLLIKGASELILEACTHYMNAEGEVCPIQDDTRKQVQDIIQQYAKQALRTICIGYRDL